MAAPTIEQILLGIEARLNGIPGLRVTEYAPGQVMVPAAVIGVPPVDNYHRAFGRGVFELLPTVTVFVSTGLDRVGQLTLAGYANPTGSLSIVQAIEGDKTLGGVVADCMVVSFQPLGLEQVGVLGYFGGIFQLRVHAQGA